MDMSAKKSIAMRTYSAAAGYLQPLLDTASITMRTYSVAAGYLQPLRDTALMLHAKAFDGPTVHFMRKPLTRTHGALRKF